MLELGLLWRPFIRVGSRVTVEAFLHVGGRPLSADASLPTASAPAPPSPATARPSATRRPS